MAARITREIEYKKLPATAADYELVRSLTGKSVGRDAAARTKIIEEIANACAPQIAAENLSNVDLKNAHLFYEREGTGWGFAVVKEGLPDVVNDEAGLEWWAVSPNGEDAQRIRLPGPAMELYVTCRTKGGNARFLERVLPLIANKFKNSVLFLNSSAQDVGENKFTSKAAWNKIRSKSDQTQLQKKITGLAYRMGESGTGTGAVSEERKKRGALWRRLGFRLVVPVTKSGSTYSLIGKEDFIPAFYAATRQKEEEEEKEEKEKRRKSKERKEQEEEKEARRKSKEAREEKEARQRSKEAREEKEARKRSKEAREEKEARQRSKEAREEKEARQRSKERREEKEARQRSKERREEKEAKERAEEKERRRQSKERKEKKAAEEEDEKKAANVVRILDTPRGETSKWMVSDEKKRGREAAHYVRILARRGKGKGKEAKVQWAFGAPTWEDEKKAGLSAHMLEEYEDWVTDEAGGKRGKERPKMTPANVNKYLQWVRDHPETILLSCCDPAGESKRSKKEVTVQDGDPQNPKVLGSSVWIPGKKIWLHERCVPASEVRRFLYQNLRILNFGSC